GLTNLLVYSAGGNSFCMIGCVDVFWEGLAKNLYIRVAPVISYSLDKHGSLNRRVHHQSCAGLMADGQQATINNLADEYITDIANFHRISALESPFHWPRAILPFLFAPPVRHTRVVFITEEHEREGIHTNLSTGRFIAHFKFGWPLVIEVLD